MLPENPYPYISLLETRGMNRRLGLWVIRIDCSGYEEIFGSEVGGNTTINNGKEKQANDTNNYAMRLKFVERAFLFLTSLSGLAGSGSGSGAPYYYYCPSPSRCSSTIISPP